MTRSAAQAALLLLFAASCALVPDDGPKTIEPPKGPQFESEDYALNAKEYMNGGQYGRAKAQWETYLSFHPNDWMARLGIAYADLFIAEDQAKTLSDVKTARRLLDEARKTFAELRTAPIEEDTATETPTPMWKTAMGSAMAARYAGYLDHLESKRAAELALRGGPEAPARTALARRLEESREKNYAESIALFEKLASMKNASPEAVRQLAQLYLVTRRDAEAEREFERYLDFARSTRENLKEGRAAAADDSQSDRAAVVAGLYDQKIRANAHKQVSVLDDLAGIAFSRGDYRSCRRRLEEALSMDTERKDLYLKLAQAEGELQMYETAIARLDEFLKRSTRKGDSFDEPIHQAMRLRREYEAKIARAK
jgi:hypothetical protein